MVKNQDGENNFFSWLNSEKIKMENISTFLSWNYDDKLRWRKYQLFFLAKNED